jgi:predicted Rossmann fold nucleotide-binding protein DprA/Smf involved in DNA uptake
VNKVTEIPRHSADFPASLKHCSAQSTPVSLYALGNLDILKQKTLALFCSIRCPGTIILQVFDFIKNIKQTKITIISGFHSPMERECLEILLRGKHPVISCPARALQEMKMRWEYKKPLEDGRLLFLSPFTENMRRQSEQNAIERNYFVAALADKIFVPYAAPESKTEQFYREINLLGKAIYTLKNELNKKLIELVRNQANIEGR